MSLSEDEVCTSLLIGRAFDGVSSLASCAVSTVQRISGRPASLDRSYCREERRPGAMSRYCSSDGSMLLYDIVPRTLWYNSS